MLLAIDVGNTNTVYGLWKGDQLVTTWRRKTDPNETEDQLAAWLHGLFRLSKLEFKVSGAICASVVPSINAALTRLCEKWFQRELLFLRNGMQVNLAISYEPPQAVGADRIANALGGIDRYSLPLIVVDFGTATTFDVVDASKTYVGGAILPGLGVSSLALSSKTASLPQVELKPPATAIGKSTVHSIQSGLIFGYAGAIDSLVGRISKELGVDPTVVSTGGDGALMLGVANSIQTYDPDLTLHGLRLAYDLLI